MHALYKESEIVHAMPTMLKKSAAMYAPGMQCGSSVELRMQKRDVLWQQDCSVLLRDCCNDINKFWGFGQAVLQ